MWLGPEGTGFAEMCHVSQCLCKTTLVSWCLQCMSSMDATRRTLAFSVSWSHFMNAGQNSVAGGHHPCRVSTMQSHELHQHSLREILFSIKHGERYKITLCFDLFREHSHVPFILTKVKVLVVCAFLFLSQCLYYDLFIFLKHLT